MKQHIQAMRHDSWVSHFDLVFLCVSQALTQDPALVFRIHLGLLAVLDFEALQLDRTSRVFAMHRVVALISLLASGIHGQRYLPPNIYSAGGDITQPGPCPGSLPPLPDFEFPHLAVPVSINKPDVAYPNTLTPFVTAGDVEMIFNFDIPASRKGQMCLFEFFLPEESDLSTSSFQIEGDYGEYVFSLSELGAAAIEGQTTYNKQPLQANPHGFPQTVHLQPGHAWMLGSTICVPGKIAVTMSSSNSSLTWFQDFNPCPIGLYITYQD
jgi:hypothetical protein